MRVAGKGLIDRDRPVAFNFDGHRYEGFAGDTLASALLAMQGKPWESSLLLSSGKIRGLVCLLMS